MNRNWIYLDLFQPTTAGLTQAFSDSVIFLVSQLAQ